MRVCIYCGDCKSPKEFSLEHIWPDALGGDYLEEFWQTSDVCRKCNSIAGVFVDGAFIKSFFTSAERANNGLQYLSASASKASIPLNYLGPVQNIKASDDEVIEFWVCSPGANILHIRPEKEEELWANYAGGDPRTKSKKKYAGRVLISLTSSEPFWIGVALRSAMQHFPKADRFVTNLAIPKDAENFKELDRNDPNFVEDSRVLREWEGLQDRQINVHCRITLDLHADGRFLAKIALGAGYKVFGDKFLDTDYAKQLRQVFREANPQKRLNLSIKGKSNLSNGSSFEFSDSLRWPAGWQLLLIGDDEELLLIVTPPSGKPLVVQITDDSSLLCDLEQKYRDGVHWLTIPAVQRSVGPSPYLDYLAHKSGSEVQAQYLELEELILDSSDLPATGIDENMG